jgi:hypothetical protein
MPTSTGSFTHPASALLAFGLTLLCACSGGGGSGAGGTPGGGGSGGGDATTHLVGAAGGTFKFKGGVTMVFPAGAVPADTTVGVQPGTATGLVPAPVPGTLLSFTPEGTTFAKPVQVTIGYDPAQLPVGSDASTMQLSNATSDGWVSYDTTVDAAAHAVTASIGHFSDWAITPGMGKLLDDEGGSVPARFFDGWTGVWGGQIATDTAGAVYLFGFQSTENGGAGPLPGAGAFVARLNANLTVQWLRPFDRAVSGRLAVDQQGNAFALGTSPYVTGVGFPLQLTSYDPSGNVRAGFPVLVGGSQTVPDPAGLAIDAVGQAHVLLYFPDLPGKVQYAVIGNSGQTVRAATTLNLGLPPGVLGLQGADLALDFGGMLYVATTYLTDKTLGMAVQGLRVTDLAVGKGFPLDLPGQGYGAFVRPVNQINDAPVAAVPLMTEPAGDSGSLYALDVATGGGLVSGFPVTIPGALPEVGSVDDAGTTWLAGLTHASGHARVWVGSYSFGGVALGARVLGATSNTDDTASSAAADPAGTFYLAGQSSTDSFNSHTFWVARVPAL